MEQIILEDSKMRQWMAEGRISVLGMLGYELEPNDINARFWRDPEVRQIVAIAQWDEKSLRARTVLQETILDVFQRMFSLVDEEVEVQVKRIQFIDDLKRLLAFIVHTVSQIAIRQEILRYAQGAGNS